VLAHFGIRKYLPTTDGISKEKKNRVYEVNNNQYTIPNEELTQWRDAFDLATAAIKARSNDANWNWNDATERPLNESSTIIASFVARGKKRRRYKYERKYWWLHMKALKEELDNISQRELEMRECTTKLLKLEGICNVRSALEYIGRQFVCAGSKESVGTILSQLSEQKTFGSYLQNVCNLNNITLESVKECFNNLYDASLKDTNDYRDEIVICAEYWDVNEIIALSAIFRHFHVKFIYWDRVSTEAEFPYEVPYWLPTLEYHKPRFAETMRHFGCHDLD
ncbi:2156_t:CDS:2, partial [Paraglomus occultum]